MIAINHYKTYCVKCALVCHVDGWAKQVFQSTFFGKGTASHHQALLLSCNRKLKLAHLGAHKKTWHHLYKKNFPKAQVNHNTNTTKKAH